MVVMQRVRIGVLNLDVNTPNEKYIGNVATFARLKRVGI